MEKKVTVCVSAWALCFHTSRLLLRNFQLVGVSRNNLQHTAKQCNTLQHTATPCNTLQHPATPCNILQHRKSGFPTQRFKECRLHPTILILYNCNTPSHLHRCGMVHVQMGSRRCCLCMCSRFFLFISHRGRVAVCYSVLQCALQSRRDSRCARPEFISSFTMTHLWKCECVLQ